MLVSRPHMPAGPDAQISNIPASLQQQHQLLQEHHQDLTDQQQLQQQQQVVPGSGPSSPMSPQAQHALPPRGPSFDTTPSRGPFFDGHSGSDNSPQPPRSFRRAASTSLDGTYPSPVLGGHAPTMVQLQGFRSVTPQQQHGASSGGGHAQAGHDAGRPQKPVLVPAAYTFIRSPLSVGPSSPTHSTLSPKPPLHASGSKLHTAHSTSAAGLPVVLASSTHSTGAAGLPLVPSASTLSSLMSSQREAQWHALYKQSRLHSTLGSAQASEDEESSDEHDAITRQLMAAVVQQESRSHRHQRHHSWHILKDELGQAPPAGGEPGPSQPGPASRTAHTRLSVDHATDFQPQADQGDASHGQGSPARVRSSYHLQSGQAAVELFLRLGRARQTVDFSKRQATVFTAGLHGRYSIWQALVLLNELREYESVLFRGVQQQQQQHHQEAAGHSRQDSLLHQAHHLHHHPHHHAHPFQHHTSPLAPHADSPTGSGNAAVAAAAALVQQAETASSSVGATEGAPAGAPGDLSLLEHAFQTAELCRQRFPGQDYLHLAGLLHGLGKLLAHKRWGSQPQWAVCGESFPLGCRFSPNILGAQFFSANPDRRRRLYSTPTGMYMPRCGLQSVTMSWGADEYLHQMLVQNRASLPAEALFVLRFRRCTALTRAGGTYSPLMDDSDEQRLPLLHEFQQLCEYRRRQLPATQHDGATLVAYYDGLLVKYGLAGLMAW